MPLEHLAEYTARLTEVFDKHGTRGTWYAHASVGCLHVRPVLNLRLEKDVKAMRAIAEEAFALVREYKGSHSGEHGDGLVRSEFHEPMFGSRLVARLRGGEGPLRSERPAQSRQDRARAARWTTAACSAIKPDYRGASIKTRARLVGLPGAGGGFQGAVEMCNNNGACRKLDGGVMCPSYRVTRDERTSRAAAPTRCGWRSPGQLGPDALASDEMAETMELCVSCKACRRECPTGVDMARMKIEVLAARVARTRAVAARPAGRLSAALRAVGRARAAGCSTCATTARCCARLRRASPGFSAQRAACRNGARDMFQTVAEALPAPDDGPRRGAVRRHLQPLFRAREPRRRA